jgi:quercetin dioxygenase-like cupin family protein
MKRHQALISFSHDHHEALVAARRLRLGADAPDPIAAVSAFLGFFAASAVPHFREEEEVLFPQVVGVEAARELVVQALLEHQRLYAGAAELRDLVAQGADSRDLAGPMCDLATLLKTHVHFEERQLFPLIEQVLSEEALNTLATAATQERNGPIWGTASEDLNATLLSWRPGAGPQEHVNSGRDVLVVVLAGSATLSTDDDEHELTVGEVAIIAKGRRRKISAGRNGVRYLSVHRRRPPLLIAPAPRRDG